MNLYEEVLIEMAVNVSGSILASLFYDQVRSNGDQTGFLVGNVVKHVKDTISDSQINNLEVETNIYVYESVPCPRDQRFFASDGKIKQQVIADLLKDKGKKIVGWYSFRRNSTLRPSFRERMLHQNLSECIPEDKNIFTFLLCSSKPNHNKSTHSFDHVFVHLVNNGFKRLPVVIGNLGDTTHTEYKHLPSVTASKSQGICSQLVLQHEEEFLNTHGQMEVRKIQSLNGSFNRKLEELSEAVIDSESHLCEIEVEVNRYRKQVRLKQLEKQQALERQNRVNSRLDPNDAQQQEMKKKPSIDDILFMDHIETDPSAILTVPNPSSDVESQTVKLDGTSETKPASVVTAKSELQNGENYTNTVTSSGKPPVKLTSPTSLHNRSGSLGKDRSFLDKGIPVVHTRSRSSDASDTLKQSGDPFSFVSGIMAESRTTKTDNIGPSKNGSSEAMETDCSVNYTDVRVGRKNSTRGAGAVLAAAKNLGQNKVKGEKSQKFEGQMLRSQGGNTNNSNSMETDEFDCAQNKSKASKTAKNCSAEAANKNGVEQEVLKDSPGLQDTFSLDVSSSPVY